MDKNGSGKQTERPVLNSDEPDKPIEELALEFGALVTKYDLASKDWREQLETLLRENPDQGIKHIREFYKKCVKDAYTSDEGEDRSGYPCGGPFEAMPRAICNAVGSVYPELTREQRDDALRQVVYGVLDGENKWIIYPGICCK